MRGDIKVSLPAQAEYVHILRSVVASASAVMDFTFDAIDDLRLVLDEACGQVLALSDGATKLNLDIGFGDDSLELRVSSDGGVNGGTESISDTMAWTILSALADDLEVEDGGSPAIRLTKSNRRAG